MSKIANPKSELEYVKGLLYGEDYYKEKAEKFKTEAKDFFQKEGKSIDTVFDEGEENNNVYIKNEEVKGIKEKEREEVSGPLNHLNLDNNIYFEEKKQPKIQIAASMFMVVLILFILVSIFIYKNIIIYENF